MQIKGCPISLFNIEVRRKIRMGTAGTWDPTENQGYSVGEVVYDKFQLVQCSQLVLSYGRKKACFKVSH